MRTFLVRAGFVLGALGAACAQSSRADDLRTTQALVEAGVFLAHAETEAAFSRLGADRPKDLVAAPAAMTFVDVGGASFGQAERGGRLGYGGASSQLRVGVDREVRSDLILGAMTGWGAGSVDSGDMNARTLSSHADVYARFKRGAGFANILFGGSMIGYRAIDRGPEEARSRGSTLGTNLRVAGQTGGTFRIQSFSFSPTLGLAAYANAVAGYSESGGLSPHRFERRSARALIGSFRMRGARSVAIDATHKLNVEAFVGAEEMLAFEARSLRVRGQDSLAARGAPNGRGLVGGVGVGTSLGDGVALKFDYDFGARDGIATHTGRGRLAISF
jgi:hypothetical protein